MIIGEAPDILEFERQQFQLNADDMISKTGVIKFEDLQCF